MIRKGKIKDFRGCWSSGLATITIEESETGNILHIPCENPSTVRGLAEAYGGITAGRSFDKSNIIDKEIYWAYDELGLIFGGFIPVEEASEEVVEAYQNQVES